MSTEATLVLGQDVLKLILGSLDHFFLARMSLSSRAWQSLAWLGVESLNVNSQDLGHLGSQRSLMSKLKVLKVKQESTKHRRQMKDLSHLFGQKFLAAFPEGRSYVLTSVTIYIARSAGPAIDALAKAKIPLRYLNASRVNSIDNQAFKSSFSSSLVTLRLSSVKEVAPPSFLEELARFPHLKSLMIFIKLGTDINRLKDSQSLENLSVIMEDLPPDRRPLIAANSPDAAEKSIQEQRECNPPKVGIHLQIYGVAADRGSVLLNCIRKVPLDRLTFDLVLRSGYDINYNHHDITLKPRSPILLLTSMATAKALIEAGLNLMQTTAIRTEKVGTVSIFALLLRQFRARTGEEAIDFWTFLFGPVWTRAIQEGYSRAQLLDLYGENILIVAPKCSETTLQFILAHPEVFGELSDVKTVDGMPLYFRKCAPAHLHILMEKVEWRARNRAGQSAPEVLSLARDTDSVTRFMQLMTDSEFVEYSSPLVWASVREADPIGQPLIRRLIDLAPHEKAVACLSAFYNSCFRYPTYSFNILDGYGAGEERFTRVILESLIQPFNVLEFFHPFKSRPLLVRQTLFGRMACRIPHHAAIIRQRIEEQFGLEVATAWTQ